MGTHIPAGEYKLLAGSGTGYYCIYADSRHKNIVANDNFEGQSYVSVTEGQYLKLSRCTFAGKVVMPQEKNLPDETEKEVVKGIAVSEFVKKYNEGVDYYNDGLEDNESQRLKYITLEGASDVNGFCINDIFTCCLNPSSMNKENIGILKIEAPNNEILNLEIARAELMSLLYAFDEKTMSIEHSSYLASQLINGKSVNENGIEYTSFTYSDVLILGGYKGFEPINDISVVDEK